MFKYLHFITLLSRTELRPHCFLLNCFLLNACAMCQISMPYVMSKCLLFQLPNYFQTFTLQVKFLNWKCLYVSWLRSPPNE